LQRLGAVLLKNSAYVLPETDETREDMEWIRGEIVAQGGEACVFRAEAVDELAHDEVVAAFVAARRADWEALQRRVTAFRERRGQNGAAADAAIAELERKLASLRNQASRIDRIDYFHAPGRLEAMAAIERAARSLRTAGTDSSPSPQRRIADYQGRRWLTRPRPGVDRMASAWLIRRFIDPRATFLFGDRIPRAGDVVPFDMFGVELGHHGDRCTFETLMTAFSLDEPALARLARIIHDLDLRSESSADSEAATVGRLVAGLRQAVPEDDRLLEHGMAAFEALYRSFRDEAGAV
jgi:hypothetical protein